MKLQSSTLISNILSPDYKPGAKADFNSVRNYHNTGFNNPLNIKMQRFDKIKTPIVTDLVRQLENKIALSNQPSSPPIKQRLEMQN
jgi:hypothetical protein